MPEPVIRTTPTRFDVTAYPGEDIDGITFAIAVEYAGHGKWAVRWLSRCLGADDEWDWEPQPSSREDDWLATHRFTLGQALAHAESHAPRIVVNGLTATQAWEKYGSKHKRDAELDEVPR
jgi:hypothetical protein